MTIDVDGGALVTGAPLEFRVEGSAPSSLGVLAVGLTRVNLPIFGGTLIPSPDTTLTVTTDSTGGASMPWTWPGLAHSDAVYAQYLILDSTAPQGFAFSNAVELRTWDPVTTLRLVTTDDLLYSRSGVPVRIDSNSGSWSGTSGEHGVAPSTEIAGSEVVIATVGELEVPEGVLLGQTFSIEAPADDAAYTHHFVTAERYQPLARSVTIDSSQLPLTPEPYHGRWRLVGAHYGGSSTAPPPFAIEAQVGMLLNQEEVAAFDAFNQVGFDTSSYDLAFNLRCNDASAVDQRIDLVLELDCSGHGYSSIPFATSMLLQSSGGGSNALTATAFGWDAAEQLVAVRLNGTLSEGDNLILLSKTPPLDAQQTHTKNPLLVGSNEDGPSAATGGGGVDCSPAPGSEPQPSFPGPCTGYPAIGSFPGCPAAGPTGGATCKTWAEEVGRVCGTGGNDGTAVFTRTESGSVSVSFQGAEATGSVSRETSTTMEYDLQDGNCGTCQTFYWMRQRCTQVFEYWAFTVKIYESINPLAIFMYSQIGCIRKTITLECNNDYGPSASPVCQRTGC